MDEWIAEAIGKMHINKITQVELAQYMGCLLYTSPSPRDS